MVKQQTKLPEFNEFYVNSALYTDYDIKQEEKDNVFNIVFNLIPIDCFCIDCSASSVFTPIDNRPTKTKGPLKSFFISNSDDWDVNLLNTFSVFQKEYFCSRNPKHKIIFLLQIKNGKLTKIGQTSSLADLAEQDIKNYKKVLGEAYFHEFSKAIGLYAHGIGVGSFVYLRRIIENFIIKPAYEEAKTQTNWNDNVYQNLRVKEKIELLKNYLPEFLVQNPSIYSIISKGIHDLTENECRIFFPVLRKSLEFVLTDLEAKRETEQKRKDMQAELGKIAGEIK
jgi:hypothetical protein